VTTLVDDYHAFLTRVLPDDYDERYQHYRHDDDLRRDFQARSFDEGWLNPDWADGLGGRDVSATDALALRLAGAARRIPRHLNIQGVGVVGPALQRFGTDAQRDELLRPTLRGDVWWALGMSEPGSGSDLASLRTSAVRRGDGYVVNGQKVWTTQADQSPWCTLYARTDPDAPKHRGISCFLLDMSLPGIEVRQIPTASPAIETFCEVFLDDVEIPVSALLGPENGGWGVAMASLEFERDMIWINTWMEGRRALAPLVGAPVPGDALADLGRSLGDLEALRLTGLRTAAQRWADLETPAFSILKLLGSQSVQAAAALTLDVLGPDALDDPALFDERMDSLSATIYGGTSEVQRTIIAERTLGLPRS
jgi:alkylation response protein AidB-like acyl-CoA dehydrogenase